MAVTRIVSNVETDRIEDAKAFYGEILGMSVVMDHGWIVMFTSPAASAPQLSFASQGGSGTPVPHLSIEVDDLDAVRQRIVRAGIAFEYGPAKEPWGVERFFVRDPFGRLVNILSHG